MACVSGYQTFGADMNSVLIASLLDMVFPRSCSGCHGRVDDGWGYLCWDCLAAINIICPPFCLLCGNPISGETVTAYLCASCSREKPFFDCARSAAHYGGLIKDMILDFKYRGAVWLGPDLGRLMLACLRANFRLENIDCLAYVPLHGTRERQRTYNQSFLLAKELAAPTGLKTGNFLRRTRATTSQTHLTAAAREANVMDKFAVKAADDVAGRSILLVDDVMTTGATVNECARVLKEAGAREVLVLTAARG